MSEPEPWLRGPLAGAPPLVAPVFFSFAQVREDLARHTAGLTVEQVWQQVDHASVGFHITHMAGSIDRLVTYLLGSELSEEQLQSLRCESEPGADIRELLQRLDKTLQQAEARLRNIDPQTIYDARQVGRKKLPTTVLGLIVHIAEHTQRHLGQAITTCKAVRQPG